MFLSAQVCIQTDRSSSGLQGQNKQVSLHLTSKRVEDVFKTTHIKTVHTETTVLESMYLHCTGSVVFLLHADLSKTHIYQRRHPCVCVGWQSYVCVFLSTRYSHKVL